MTTIYALSSGAPPAALAVVRISGANAGPALRALAGRLPVPRRAGLATLRDPANGEALDQALILWFPGPASATGEDLAELHLHGGRAVVARVLSALVGIDGLMPAGPGDFTRRAFENGRIDLAEAEGLSDLLFAETELQRRSALAVAGGALSAQVAEWQDRLLVISAQVEALLDFSDEDDVTGPEDGRLQNDVAVLAREIDDWLARPSGERLRDGVRVALAGPPNAGKSTLLNALAGREAAIVSPRAGTTRDVIEVPLALAGRPFVLIDMAGLHEGTGDEIEAVGIERARQVVAESDIILWLGDEAADPTFDSARTIRVHARADLPGRDMELGGAVSVSAIRGTGLSTLIDALVARADMMLPRPGEIALNRRQRDMLAECRSALGSVFFTDLLLLAESLRLSRMALDRLTGRAGTEQMLDALFGRFCIGK
jgi:tRNA modification GTPase